MITDGRWNRDDQWLFELSCNPELDPDICRRCFQRMAPDTYHAPWPDRVTGGVTMLNNCIVRAIPIGGSG